MKDKDATTTKEAEERNATEAKRVEACVFQTQGAGSSPVGSTMDKFFYTKLLRDTERDILNKMVETALSTNRSYNQRPHPGILAMFRP